MKNWILGTMVVLFNVAFGQDWSTDKYVYDELYEGYVITKEGERLNGYVKYRNRYIMQEEVVFYREKDNINTKKRYDAGDLIEYAVADKVYHCINYSGGESLTDIRGLLLVNGNGCIREYVWYGRASGYNTFTLMEGETEEQLGNRKFPPTKVYHRKGDEMAVTDAFFTEDFQKKMSNYLKDNKEMYRKVKSGESNYDKVMNIRAIFDEYNSGCR